MDSTIIVGLFTIPLLILSYLLGRKNFFLEKAKLAASISKSLLITVTHGKELALVGPNGPVYSGYKITIKIIKTGNYRVILSSVSIVDEFENELYSVKIPTNSQVINSHEPVFISKTIPLENNPLLRKISEGSFQILISDTEGKTYLGRPKYLS